MSTTATTEERVMGQVIPRQHPAVVLKSSYDAVRALLAAALVAVAALAATVVIVTADTDTKVSVAPKSAQALPSGPTAARPAEPIHYGGFNPATGKPVQQETLPPGTRFDGGPDEGTRGITPQTQSYWQQASPRTSYEPTSNEGFKARAGGPPVIPMGPGGR
jgi:hypothetical protein